MLKNIIKVLSANGIVALIGLANSLLLPKLISIEEYALYQTFMLYLSYIAILHFGFPTGMNIKYAGKKIESVDKSQYKSEMRVLFCILGVFSFVGMILTIRNSSSMSLYITLMIFPYCFLGSFSLLLQAFGKFQEYAILHTIMSAVPLLLPIIIYLITRQASGIICIGIYIGVYVIATIYCMLFHHSVVHRVKSNKLLSLENWEIEKVGFFFLLGNYINSLFHSVDKQFVSWSCSTNEFSYYSFALTMQNVMTIFITAVAQPMFPYMAAGKVKDDGYTKIKRYLFILGSFSGIAYFVCNIVVCIWLPNYIESLEIIKIYFAVFPAMAVINSIYINLYKTRKMTKSYIRDLLLMLLAAIVGNGLAIQFGYGYRGVALVTTLLYYIWLIFGSFIFKELKISFREYLFLFIFIILFITIPNLFKPVMGAIVYLVLDIFACVLCFPDELRLIIKMLTEKRKGKIDAK